MKFNRLPWCLALLFVASTCFAQMYTITDLGTLPDGNFSNGVAINALGEVVGYANSSAGANHAFLYSGSTMTELGTLPGGSTSAAYGINADGQVTGYSSAGCCVLHAFLFSGGTMIDLGMLPGGSYTSFGFGINAFGEVAVSSDLGTSNVFHAFLYSGGTRAKAGRWIVGRGKRWMPGPC